MDEVAFASADAAEPAFAAAEARGAGAGRFRRAGTAHVAQRLGDARRLPAARAAPAFTIFVALPMGEAAWYSVFNWNGYGRPERFIGLKNYDWLHRATPPSCGR